MDWDKLSSEFFEKLVFRLLGSMGFKNRLWYGRGGETKGGTS